MRAESQFHWCGYWCGPGLVKTPVSFSRSTEIARSTREVLLICESCWLSSLLRGIQHGPILTIHPANLIGWEAQPDIVARCNAKRGMRGYLDKVVADLDREEI